MYHSRLENFWNYGTVCLCEIKHVYFDITITTPAAFTTSSTTTTEARSAARERERVTIKTFKRLK